MLCTFKLRPYFIHVHSGKGHEGVDDTRRDILLDDRHGQIHANDDLQGSPDEESRPDSARSREVELVTQSGSEPEVVDVSQRQIVRPAGGAGRLTVSQQFLSDFLIFFVTGVVLSAERGRTGSFVQLLILDH